MDVVDDFIRHDSTPRLDWGGRDAEAAMCYL